MRTIFGLCFLLIAIPLLADTPIASGPGSLASWKGKHADELFAELGQPHKVKRDGKHGKVLVYRLRFYGSRSIGETKVYWSEAGIGPSPQHEEERANPDATHGPTLSFSGGLAPSSTQKVKFYVDDRGIVQREEFGRRKWKKGRD